GGGVPDRAVAAARARRRGPRRSARQRGRGDAARPHLRAQRGLHLRRPPDGRPEVLLASRLKVPGTCLAARFAPDSSANPVHAQFVRRLGGGGPRPDLAHPLLKALSGGPMPTADDLLSAGTALRFATIGTYAGAFIGYAASLAVKKVRVSLVATVLA